MGVRRDLELNFDFEIVDEFLDHYAMMVDIMEPLMVDLNSETRYKNAVDELFRVFHNIKSASRFLQLEPISRLTTLVEDALDHMRAMPGPASDEVINWLLKIHDMFAQWQDDLKLDNTLSKIQFDLLKIPDLEQA